MALVIADRVRETSTTTGTGTYTLAGAETGFRTFSTAIGNGNTTLYVAVMGSNWEVGLGTVGAGTLARTTILASSNAGSAVNWSAGTKQIGCSPAAAYIALLQGGNTFLGNQTLQNASGSDVVVKVLATGDQTPRLSLQKSSVSSHTAREVQFRLDSSGRLVLRDETAGADRLMIDTDGLIRPGTTNEQDLGTSSLRFRSLLLSGGISIAATSGREVDVNCSGDGNAPGIRLRKTGVSSDTAHDFRIVLNTDGQMAIRDETNATDRLILGLNGVLKPAQDNTYNLGNSADRWLAVFAVNGTIQTSDERDKAAIEDSELGLELVDRLRPVSYRWKEGPDQGTHHGLIAQEMVEALRGRKFDGLHQDPESGRYGLSYAELVPVLIKAVQELSARVRQLEEQLA